MRPCRGAGDWSVYKNVYDCHWTMEISNIMNMRTAATSSNWVYWPEPNTNYFCTHTHTHIMHLHTSQVSRVDPLFTYRTTNHIFPWLPSCISSSIFILGIVFCLKRKLSIVERQATSNATKINYIRLTGFSLSLSRERNGNWTGEGLMTSNRSFIEAILVWAYGRSYVSVSVMASLLLLHGHRYINHYVHPPFLYVIYRNSHSTNDDIFIRFECERERCACSLILWFTWIAVSRQIRGRTDTHGVLALKSLTEWNESVALVTLFAPKINRKILWKMRIFE